jgi:hypothetical protein
MRLISSNTYYSSRLWSHLSPLQRQKIALWVPYPAQRTTQVYSGRTLACSSGKTFHFLVFHFIFWFQKCISFLAFQFCILGFITDHEYLKSAPRKKSTSSVTSQSLLCVAQSRLLQSHLKLRSAQHKVYFFGRISKSAERYTKSTTLVASKVHFVWHFNRI